MVNFTKIIKSGGVQRPQFSHLKFKMLKRAKEATPLLRHA